MLRTKKALLLLAFASTLFASGCLSTALKWLEAGYYGTSILDNVGVITG